MNFLVIIPVLAAMIALRFARMNALGWFFAWWFAIYITLSYGIKPPLPASIIFMFMGIVTIVLVAYLSSDSANLQAAIRSIVNFLTAQRFAVPRLLVIALLPALVALRVYLEATRPVQAPISGRTIHPPPPREIQFKGKPINLVSGTNPYRELESTHPDSFKMHIANGRRVYFENCVFCHGDDMKGDGIFAHGFDPIPANFSDPTTIAMLQETYLFWRIAKGGPGLPSESFPWASAMPAWEKFLNEQEIWDVILFLYDYTGQKPRAQEVTE